MLTDSPTKHPILIPHTLSENVSLQQKMTNLMLLRNFEPQTKATFVEKALRLQDLYREQMYRYIRTQVKRLGRDKVDVKRLTFSLNCPPSGFSVNPKSLFCRNPVICPWCFVRKMHSVVKDLTTELKIRNLDKLVVWKRLVGLGENPPFFRSNYGPHTWLDADFSVQMIVPFPVKEKLYAHHFGFQLVPSHVDVNAALEKRLAIKRTAKTFACRVYKDVTPYSLLEVVCQFTQLSWASFLLSKQTDNYITAATTYKHRKLLRVSKKRRGDKKRGE